MSDNNNFAKDLCKYLQENKINENDLKFPNVFYNKDGDMIEVILSNDLSYGKYIDNFITLHLSMEDDKIVGINIKNIDALINNKKPSPCMH